MPPGRGSPPFYPSNTTSSPVDDEEEHLTFDYNVTFQARGSQQSSHGGVDYPKSSSSQGKTSLFFIVVK